MKFRVTIRKDGAPDTTRIFDATSRFDVYGQVKNEGGFVTSIEEQHPFDLGKLAHTNIYIGTGIKRIEIIQTAKNLAAMLAAGLSISRALSVIERQSSNPRLKTIIGDIAESVKKGSSFHEAVGEFPNVFPDIFRAMARAGEESGSLSNSLAVVAVQMERSEELIRKIRGAMIYPAIVILAVIVVAILMLIYVVPTLTKTFTALGVDIPLSTKVIVTLSDFMATHSFLVLVVCVVLLVGGFLFIRSRIGSRTIVAFSLHIPVIQELVRETYAARASRTLSSLLSAGVPVLDALAITKEVVRVEVFANVIAEAEAHVKKGELLSTSFGEHTKLYPVLMSDMLAVGEETGKVADMLKQIAEFYEEDVGQKTKDLSSIVEPVLMLLIGAVVGVFAVSIIAPIYSLSSAF